MEHLEAGARQAEAFAKMHEAVAQQKEVEAGRKEAKASKKEEDVRRLEEKAWQSLEKAERLEASIRIQAEASATKMHEGQQNVEEQLREKERYLQIREAEIQTMFQAVDERRQAMNLEEDSLQRRLDAAREQEEKLCLREAALTRQMMAIEAERNRAARDSDLVSLASSIRNSTHDNVGVSPKSNARFKEESEYHGNEV